MVTEDGSVLGTIHKVESFEAFSNVPEEQSGYYFPLHLSNPDGQKMTLSINGQAKKKGIPYDQDIIFRIEGKDTKATIGVDGQVVVKLNFERADFEA